MSSLKEATDAKTALRMLLGRPEWLRGVGIGMQNGSHCIQVNVATFNADVQAQVPTEVDGVPVNIKVVGDIVPF